MLAKRIIHALLTLASIGIFIWTESPVALFTGVLLIAVPVITFIMLTVAKRSVRFNCNVRETCMRGGVLGIEMKIGVKPRFFVGSAEVLVQINNTTFDKIERKMFIFDNLAYAPGRYEYMGHDSGRIRIEVVEIHLIDMFGLCSIKFRKYHCFESIVAPKLYTNLQVSLHGVSSYKSAGETVDVAHRGSDRSEIFNVREYVAGDSLNAVHWKLSGKFDSLMTKEFGSSNHFRSLIFVDLSRNKNGHCATDEDLNCILDVAVSLSDAFLAQGVEHCVGWIDEGRFRFFQVRDNDTFIDMIFNLMSIKVTEEDARVALYLASEADVSDYSNFVFVSTEATPNELKQLDSDVTAICVGDTSGEYAGEKFRIINMRSENLITALTAAVL